MSDSVRRSSVDTGPVHLACNPLPMLTRHQQLIEVHVRRKGQFAAVPFSAHQGLKVSRYHVGAAPYVFAQKKKPHLPSIFFETRGSHQSHGLTGGGLQRVRNFVSPFGF